MIFIDSDVFLIDLRYRRDQQFPENREFLERLRETGRGVTTIFNLLEICGVLSFNLKLPSQQAYRPIRQQLWELFHYFPRRYGMRVLPRATPV
jgi:predicted nucleic acid-binding protein